MSSQGGTRRSSMTLPEIRVRIKSPSSIPRHRGIHAFEVLGERKAQAEPGGQAGSVVTDLVSEGWH